MRQSMILAVVCGLIALLCLAFAGLFFVERPTVIQVAIPMENQSDTNLLTAASKIVRHGHHPIRFKIVPVDAPQTAAGRIDDGTVDMAVVRTDGPMPAQGQTVVILHRDAAILVAPGGSDLKSIGDLAGHTIGVVEHATTNQNLLTMMLAQYDLPHDAVNTVSLPLESVTEALKSKRVDALMVVGILSSSKVQGVVKAVAKASAEAPVFLPIADAAAIAQRLPGIDSFTVVKGSFHGAPPRPEDEFDTLSITHRLVASTTLSDSVVADVTRFFLSERSALVAIDPLAQRIEAPPTDKGSALPTHSGTVAYLDDEEETFLDRYSDYIYLAAMFFGVLASGATAIFSRLNARGTRAVEQLIERLMEILKLVRDAPSVDALDGFQAEADGIVSLALDRELARGLDERCFGTLNLALNQVRDAIRDRRNSLAAAENGLPGRNYASGPPLFAE